MRLEGQDPDHGRETYLSLPTMKRMDEEMGSSHGKAVIGAQALDIKDAFLQVRQETNIGKREALKNLPGQSRSMSMV